MPPFQTGTSFSWEVISQDEAIKHCDRTVFNDRQTGIPKEKVITFFEIENLSPGQEKLIYLEMSYITYPATISVQKHGSERAKLKWGNDLGKILETYENYSNCLIHFEKMTPRYYRITMIIDELQSYTDVEHSLETFVDVTNREAYVEGKQVAMYVTKYERDPKNRAEAIRQKLTNALKPNGTIYASFKYGDFEGERGGRYFTDLTETTFTALIAPITNLELVQSFITTDVRPGRQDERWLNVIVMRIA